VDNSGQLWTSQPRNICVQWCNPSFIFVTFAVYNDRRKGRAAAHRICSHAFDQYPSLRIAVLTLLSFFFLCPSFLFPPRATEMPFPELAIRLAPGAGPDRMAMKRAFGSLSHLKRCRGSQWNRCLSAKTRGYQIDQTDLCEPPQRGKRHEWLWMFSPDSFTSFRENAKSSDITGFCVISNIFFRSSYCLMRCSGHTGVCQCITRALFIHQLTPAQCVS
jgi:hypothetical protein